MAKRPFDPKYYAWYTNSLRIKKDSITEANTNDYNVYLGDVVAKKLPVNTGVDNKIDLKYNQWHKITYSVIDNANDNTKSDLFFYYKNEGNGGYASAALSEDTSLAKIVFCTTACTLYFTDGVWSSGAYKLLKVWNAKEISVDLFRSFDS